MTQMMQAMMGFGAVPNLCAPARVTLVPGAEVFGPWAPLVAMAWDPRTNPWLAVGMAYGPFAWGLRIREGRE
jgi:hypothetical protein